MVTLDLNCDLGEGAGSDEAILPFVTSANIACGAHAGDSATMRRISALANSLGVAVGAHPGFPDREGFGRRELEFGAEETGALVKAQVQDLQRISEVRHVKTHGALYTLAARDRAVARAVARAVRECDPHLILFALSGSVQVEEGERAGLRVAHEVFADRTYQRDGSLTPRTRPDAMIRNEEDAIAQVLCLARTGMVRATDGNMVTVRADTVCLHGDGRNAVEFARRIRQALLSDKVILAPVFASPPPGSDRR
ncbi:MAG: LamB/YcsF family protein [Opitutaceae bacterium]|jgi:UPF0271 protein|nr:LamB/YcsF family protein [Opitutaceae bacterium]